jgi:hypothetical protein
MRRQIGGILLGLSLCGYPLTQFVIRRCGRRGALAVEAVTMGLVLRDATMVASGVPRRLRRVPALLLWLELGAGVAATAAGLGPVLRRASDEPLPAADHPLEVARRTAVGALFALHTVRFWIYLRPDRGRRP